MIYPKQLFLFILIFYVGKPSNIETMTWNANRKLTWEDFKSKPDLQSDAVALTASGITFGYSLKMADKKIVDFSTTVEAHFYPNKSWCYKDKRSDHILRHEQLHFDVTELYARKFRAQIGELKANQNLKSQLNKLHNSIVDALNKMQRRYDKETEHSMDTKMQGYWQDAIEKKLQSLEAYKST